MTTLQHLKTTPGYIGIREAADLIDVNRYTLLDWVRDGKFPATKIGNAIKIDRHDLAEWIEDRQISGGAFAASKARRSPQPTV